MGDSHNNGLLAAYEMIGRERGWQFTVTGKNGCYWTDAKIDKGVEALTTACAQWQQNFVSWLDQQPPFDAIVATFSRGGDQPFQEPGRDRWDLATEGLVGAWSAAIEAGTPVIGIRDVPRLRPDVVTCVSASPSTAVERCSSTLAEALGTRDPIVEAGSATGSPVIDLTHLYCDASTCSPVIGMVMAYKNADHLTATFVRTLAPTLGQHLEQALSQIGVRQPRED